MSVEGLIYKDNVPISELTSLLRNTDLQHLNVVLSSTRRVAKIFGYRTVADVAVKQQSAILLDMSWFGQNMTREELIAVFQTIQGICSVYYPTAWDKAKKFPNLLRNVDRSELRELAEAEVDKYIWNDFNFNVDNDFQKTLRTIDNGVRAYLFHLEFAQHRLIETFPMFCNHRSEEIDENAMIVSTSFRLQIAQEAWWCIRTIVNQVGLQFLMNLIGDLPELQKNNILYHLGYKSEAVIIKYYTLKDNLSEADTASVLSDFIKAIRLLWNRYNEQFFSVNRNPNQMTTTTSIPPAYLLNGRRLRRDSLRFQLLGKRKEVDPLLKPKERVVLQLSLATRKDRFLYTDAEIAEKVGFSPQSIRGILLRIAKIAKGEKTRNKTKHGLISTHSQAHTRLIELNNPKIDLSALTKKEKQIFHFAVTPTKSGNYPNKKTIMRRFKIKDKYFLYKILGKLNK